MTTQPRPYVLAETNWKEIQQHIFDIAVLPWGATEAHNYHMPYATDNYQVDAIAHKAAGKAWEKGTKVLILPTIPFGVNTGQLDIAYCMNMNPSTQLAILKDVCDVVNKGDHADEMETSVMMYLHPELLLPLDMAGDGANKKFTPKGFQEGWAWTQRPWTKITKDTGVGDPSKSTPDKGKAFIEKCTDNIAEFFCEINQKNIETLLK